MNQIKNKLIPIATSPSSLNFSTRGLGIENGRKPSAMLRNVLQCSEMCWNGGERVLKYSRMFWCALKCLTCYCNDIRYEMLHSTRSYNMIGSSFYHHCCVFQIFATLDGRKLAGSGTEFIWLIVIYILSYIIYLLESNQNESNILYLKSRLKVVFKARKIIVKLNFELISVDNIWPVVKCTCRCRSCRAGHVLQKVHAQSWLMHSLPRPSCTSGGSRHKNRDFRHHVREDESALHIYSSEIPSLKAHCWLVSSIHRLIQHDPVSLRAACQASCGDQIVLSFSCVWHVVQRTRTLPRTHPWHHQQPALKPTGFHDSIPPQPRFIEAPSTSTVNDIAWTSEKKHGARIWKVLDLPNFSHFSFSPMFNIFQHFLFDISAAWQNLADWVRLDLGQVACWGTAQAGQSGAFSSKERHRKAHGLHNHHTKNIKTLWINSGSQNSEHDIAVLLSTHQSHHPQGHQIAPGSGPWLAFHCWNLTSTFTIIWIYILHTFSGVRPPGPLGCQPLQSIKHLPDWPTASNKRSQKYQFRFWKNHRKEKLRTGCGFCIQQRRAWHGMAYNMHTPISTWSYAWHVRNTILNILRELLINFHL